MLAGLTNTDRHDIWCELSNITNTCARRLLKKERQRHSWTSKKFPNTEVEIRVDMRKYTPYGGGKTTFRCEIKLGKTKKETFTQKQVDEYITENILLGVNSD